MRKICSGLLCVMSQDDDGEDNLLWPDVGNEVVLVRPGTPASLLARNILCLHHRHRHHCHRHHHRQHPHLKYTIDICTAHICHQRQQRHWRSFFNSVYFFTQRTQKGLL